MDYLKLIEDVRKYTEQSVKKSRFEHSVRVAEMTARLCRHYGLDEIKGYLAGIGHDMCKELPSEEMKALALKDGAGLSEYEQKTVSLLHGRAAAVLMQEKFGIEDKDVIEAVANHVSAKLGICDLGKCLFLADKREPARPQSTDEYRANLFKLSLNGMFYSVLNENYEYLTGRGVEVSPDTLNMLEYYREIVRNEEKNQE